MGRIAEKGCVVTVKPDEKGWDELPFTEHTVTCPSSTITVTTASDHQREPWVIYLAHSRPKILDQWAVER